jgi:hypothetical protein
MGLTDTTHLLTFFVHVEKRVVVGRRLTKPGHRISF